MIQLIVKHVKTIEFQHLLIILEYFILIHYTIFERHNVI